MVDVVVTAIVVGLSYRFIESSFRTRGRHWLATRREPANRM
jgi:peptidoglycan/LPS O-acetylase OafA/YrhL